MAFTPPAVPQFPAGWGPLAADFNGWVQNSLGFQTTGIVFRAEQTTNQSLSSGNNIITYNTVLEDPYSGWDATSHQYVAPYTGWYEVCITVTVPATNLVVSAQVETPQTYATVALTSQPGTFMGGACGYTIVPLAGGSDWVKGSINVSASTTTNNVNVGRYTTLEISFVSQQ